MRTKQAIAASQCSAPSLIAPYSAHQASEVLQGSCLHF